MKTLTVREKLYNYIRFAEDKKVKALYTLVEDEIETKSDHWEDPDFLAMLDQCLEEYEKGKVKLETWDEIKAKLK